MQAAIPADPEANEDARVFALIVDSFLQLCVYASRMTRTKLHRLQGHAIRQAMGTTTRLQQEMALSRIGVLEVFLDQPWFPWLAMSAAVAVGALLALGTHAM